MEQFEDLLVRILLLAACISFVSINTESTLLITDKFVVTSQGYCIAMGVYCNLGLSRVKVNVRELLQSYAPTGVHLFCPGENLRHIVKLKDLTCRYY